MYRSRFSGFLDKGAFQVYVSPGAPSRMWWRRCSTPVREVTLAPKLALRRLGSSTGGSSFGFGLTTNRLEVGELAAGVGEDSDRGEFAVQFIDRFLQLAAAGFHLGVPGFVGGGRPWVCRGFHVMPKYFTERAGHVPVGSTGATGG